MVKWFLARSTRGAVHRGPTEMRSPHALTRHFIPPMVVAYYRSHLGSLSIEPNHMQTYWIWACSTWPLETTNTFTVQNLIQQTYLQTALRDQNSET